VLAMLDEKSKGKEIVVVTAPAPQRGGKVVDIMEALKRSMERIPAKRKPAAADCI
jgi:non-homologous end joining protein Ku